jgi:hypothetical protein
MEMLIGLDDIKTAVERALPADVVEAMREHGVGLKLVPEFEPIVAISDELAEMEQLEHMVTYRKDVTGVDNTIFISPGLRVRHAPRIKVAISPPDSINPLSEQGSVEISTGKVVAGEVPPELLKQVQQFIELNRPVLLDYWHCWIDTKQLQERLKAI